MAFYDNETQTIRITCQNCKEEIDVDVRADVEINSYITIKEN